MPININGLDNTYSMLSAGSQIGALGNMASDSSALAANKVKSQLNNISSQSSDEELMEACKSFESYMIEHAFKTMRETVTSINKDDEDDNEYMQLFGENLYEEYANKAVQNSSLGIAQMLFDSIKRGNIIDNNTSK